MLFSSKIPLVFYTILVHTIYSPEFLNTALLVTCKDDFELLFIKVKKWK